jgi:hypothetical protein
MRTAIFVSGYLIANAIKEISSGRVAGMCALCVMFVIWDVLEAFKGK